MEDAVGVPLGMPVLLLIVLPFDILSVNTVTGPGPGYCAEADWLSSADTAAAVMTAAMTVNRFCIFMTLTTPSLIPHFPCVPGLTKLSHTFHTFRTAYPLPPHRGARLVSPDEEIYYVRFTR